MEAAVGGKGRVNFLYSCRWLCREALWIEQGRSGEVLLVTLDIGQSWRMGSAKIMTSFFRS
jgi:hypothetical protein